LRRFADDRLMADGLWFNMEIIDDIDFARSYGGENHG